MREDHALYQYREYKRICAEIDLNDKCEVECHTRSLSRNFKAFSMDGKSSGTIRLYPSPPFKRKGTCPQLIGVWCLRDPRELASSEQTNRARTAGIPAPENFIVASVVRDGRKPCSRAELTLYWSKPRKICANCHCVCPFAD
jgi:hypothetical protein